MLLILKINLNYIIDTSIDWEINHIFQTLSIRWYLVMTLPLSLQFFLRQSSYIYTPVTRKKNEKSFQLLNIFMWHYLIKETTWRVQWHFIIFCNEVFLLNFFLYTCLRLIWHQIKFILLKFLSSDCLQLSRRNISLGLINSVTRDLKSDERTFINSCGFDPFFPLISRLKRNIIKKI